MTHINSLVVGDGRIPAVFLHGLFGQGKNWVSVARQLSDQCTCLLLDAPDHGRSGWTDHFDYDDYSEALFAEIVAHERFADGFVLVGHSMGGKIAMRMALTHPDAVRLLVVVDISPVAGHVGSNFPALVAAMRALPLAEIPDRTSADAALASGVPDAVVRGFLLQNLHRVHGEVPCWAWRMNLALLGDSLGEVGKWPAIDAVYPGPVLWLAGETSSYVAPEHVPLMRALFPRAVLVTIKGAGHWVHSEQPKAFVASLKAFLALNYVSGP